MPYGKTSMTYPGPPRPPGSGLSSSAAIVCSSMLATLAALGKGDQLSKADIAESACKVRQSSCTAGTPAPRVPGRDPGRGQAGQTTVGRHNGLNSCVAEGHETSRRRPPFRRAAAKILTGCLLAVGPDPALQAERYVGVTSGGMDQAISMMGQVGAARVLGGCGICADGGMDTDISMRGVWVRDVLQLCVLTCAVGAFGHGRGSRSSYLLSRHVILCVAVGTLAACAAPNEVHSSAVVAAHPSGARGHASYNTAGATPTCPQQRWCTMNTCIHAQAGVATHVEFNLAHHP